MAGEIILGKPKPEETRIVNLVIPASAFVYLKKIAAQCNTDVNEFTTGLVMHSIIAIRENEAQLNGEPEPAADENPEPTGEVH